MAKKIMVVDDDPQIVSYLVTLLGDNGFETCSASDGDAAMEVLERERPDCITLDLEMPHEWGPRFYRKFSQKEEFKNLPVVVISGLTGHDMAIRKAVAAIHKPFEPEAVLTAVKKACGE
ncbi:MAG: DVU0259 family response regulator domain-containing protein [Solidesulfovibrio sp. DCME]|uniref:DVU0259 family response regulator domain-containing protein n=1 Tax=Solidesulfovibrio sp. DCME TaxID=3447380 RepID=UPI003D0FFED4